MTRLQIGVIGTLSVLSWLGIAALVETLGWRHGAAACGSIVLLVGAVGVVVAELRDAWPEIRTALRDE